MLLYLGHPAANVIGGIAPQPDIFLVHGYQQNIGAAQHLKRAGRIRC